MPRKGEIAAFIERAAVHTEDQCLEWPFRRKQGPWGGYGIIQTRGQPGNRRAHRIVCERAHGPPPPDKPWVAHSCGNPACVNAAHLRWATPKENSADQINHGTRNRGERHGHVKLTEAKVLEIRALEKRGVSRDELANIFAVSKLHIGRIVRRERWDWL